MAGSILIPLKTVFDDKGIKQAQSSLAGLGSSMKSLIAPALAVFSTTALVNFGKSAVAATSNLNEVGAAVDQVFGAASQQLRDYATTTSATMGQSQAQFLNAAKTFGIFGKAAGLAETANANFSTELSKLASDLASFNNTSVDEAITAIGAGLRGESEPLRRFGVLLDDATLKAEATSLGIYKGSGALTQQQKILAAHSAILKQTTTQQGDFARTSDGLANSQRTLTAVIEDASAEIGTALTPAITSFVKEIVPLIREYVPTLTAELKKIPFDKVAKDLIGMLTWVTKNATAIRDWAVAIGATVAALKIYQTATAIATGLTTAFSTALRLNPIGAAITGLTLLAGAMAIVADKGKDANDQIYKFNQESGKINPTNVYQGFLGNATNKKLAQQKFGISAGNSGVMDAYNYAVTTGTLNAITGGTTGGGGGAETAGKKAATNYVKEFATSMADEMRKQMARIRLANKGLSTDFIESIIGSGAGWYKVYQSIIGQSSTALGRLQQNFNKTAAGLAEIAKAAEEAAAKTKEANDKLIADLTATLETVQGKLDAINQELNPTAKSVLEVYQDAKRAYEELTASSAQFAKTIPDVVSGIRNMTQLAEPIGQFEQQVVSSFANVEASLKSALDSKLITDQSYADLSAWAKREMSLMQDIARQRDELAKKISLAEAVYNDSKNAILAYGNINGLLKTTSQTITETQTKIVDGITISLTKSVEQVSQNNLVDQYKAILQKTKDFANNLNALKKMGLNKDLFKQIVDAGVETGGATAAAIIQGGQQGVTELNNVFTDLQAVGDQVGETTAVVMFNNGVDVMGGFINGMKAQEASLAATAKTLAETFATAFGTALKTALQIAIDAAKEQMKTAMAALLAEKAALEAEIAGLKTQIGNVGKPGPSVVVPPVPLTANNGAVGSVDARIGNQYFNVTVTNNDPNAVVDALKRYTKQNGVIAL